MIPTLSATARTRVRLHFTVVAAVLSCLPVESHAQARTGNATPCLAPDGRELPADECLNLPPVQEATNFLPLLLPALIGGTAIAALASGGRSTSATGTTRP